LQWHLLSIGFARFNVKFEKKRSLYTGVMALAACQAALRVLVAGRKFVSGAQYAYSQFTELIGTTPFNAQGASTATA
jgi:hypothetical protein